MAALWTKRALVVYQRDERFLVHFMTLKALQKLFYKLKRHLWFLIVCCKHLTRHLRSQWALKELRHACTFFINYRFSNWGKSGIFSCRFRSGLWGGSTKFWIERKFKAWNFNPVILKEVTTGTRCGKMITRGRTGRNFCASRPVPVKVGLGEVSAEPVSFYRLIAIADFAFFLLQ